MLEQIKKPSTPSNYAKNKVDDQISLAQQTEERWLHTVIINSRWVFKRRSFSTSRVARSPATRDFYSYASLTSNWRSPKSFAVCLQTGAIRVSSNTTLMKCSVSESIKLPQATRTAMTPTCCATILPFRPSSAKPILWPLSPRFRAWRVRRTGTASDDLASFVLSGLFSMATPSEKLPKKSCWTLTPPMIPATASRCLLFFMANTASICITRCFFSKATRAVCSRPGFAPAMPRPQRQSPLSLGGWFPGLSDALLRVRSAIGPMPARPLQRSIPRWSRSKSSMPSGLPPTRYFNEEPSAGLNGRSVSMPAIVTPCGSSIVFAIGPEAGKKDDGLWSKSKWVLWAPTSVMSLPIARLQPKRSLTATTIGGSARTASKNSSVIFAPSGFPVTAIAPMPCDFNFMPWLTNCWFYSGGMSLDTLSSLTRAWKPYGLSCSKSPPALSAPPAAFGFISPRAGRDAICLWRSGRNSAVYREPRRLNSALSHHIADIVFRHSQSQASVFSQNPFSLRPIPSDSIFWSLAWDKIETFTCVAADTANQ